ncbi:MAG: M20 family metallopeptidase [Desulforhabdus sp.]|jgi:glutamate carboxypeptidase|nr:M20 family metallopeptidase [Desulforhabdus sp.]
MDEFLRFVESKEPEMLDLLERLVNIDSGTYNIDGVNICGRVVAAELEGLGFRTEVVEETECGSHIRAERPGTGSKRVLLSAHLDTVFPKGTAVARPFRRQGNLAFGPGVGDIKGGIVQMLYALKTLHHHRRASPFLSVFLTADEEIGSIRGRPHIEEIARRSTHVLVMEPASTPESIAVRRWGIGSFYLTIHGKAAHVLKPDSEGVNACRELALKILALESLTNIQRGIKVSVNLVRGGRSRQVTAASARADIDVRIREAALMEEVEEQIRQVAGAPILPGIRVNLEGGMTRPPMEPHRQTEELFELAKEVAEAVNMKVAAVEEYGGSDGCFTSALGVATLDALGPVCHDMCGDEERIEVASLAPRTALLAGILQRLAES